MATKRLWSEGGHPSSSTLITLVGRTDLRSSPVPEGSQEVLRSRSLPIKSRWGGTTDKTEGLRLYLQIGREINEKGVGK